MSRPANKGYVGLIPLNAFILVREWAIGKYGHKYGRHEVRRACHYIATLRWEHDRQEILSSVETAAPTDFSWNEKVAELIGMYDHIAAAFEAVKSGQEIPEKLDPKEENGSETTA